MNLLNRLATDFRLMLQRPPRRQYAALCHRQNRKSGLEEVLVLTSRDSGRWIIPKGWPMDGKNGSRVAEQEAYEEAGVRGSVGATSIGSYCYQKRLSNGVEVTCLVHVYPLEVRSMEKNFKEKGSRRLEWVTPAQASARVNEPELKALIAEFMNSRAKARPDDDSRRANG